MAGKAQKWLAKARVGTEKNEQVSAVQVFRVQFPPKKTPQTSIFIPSRRKCLLMLRCPEAETMSSFNRNYLARFPGSIHINRPSGRKNTICWGVVTGQGCK